MVRSRLIRRLIAGSLISVVAASLAIPVAARTPARPAGVPSLTVFLKVNDCRLDIMAVPQSPTADPAVTITVKTGTTVKLKRTVSSAGGQAQARLCPTLFRPGDTVKIAANGQSRTVTVPALSAQIDPVAKRVRGHVPAGGTFIVDLWNCDLYPSGACTGILNVADPIVSSKGIWSVDLALNTAWRPGFGDYVNVSWRPTGDPDGDQFFLEQPLDNASIRVGSAIVTGNGRPGMTVTLSLVEPGGAMRASATARASGVRGAWRATLRDRDGAKVQVRVGDTLRTNLRKTATRPGASIKAVDLQATVTTDGTNSLEGTATCKPGRRLGVLLPAPESAPFSTLYYEDIADQNGTMSFSDTSVAVPVGTPFQAHCVSPRFLDQMVRGTTVAP